MSPISRRSFLQSTSAVAGVSIFATGTSVFGKPIGANDRLRIAVAGLNGRGSTHIEGWLGQHNVEIAYLIDPDQDVLNRTLKDIDKDTSGKSTPQGLSDVREALDDTNLDAISIATPNHWHSLMTIWAAQAGKHVYVEKPMSHDVAEGRVAVEAQKKYGVVIQHGTQQPQQRRHRRSARGDPGRQVRQAEDLLRLLLQAARRHRLQSRLRSAGQPRLEPLARPGR